MRSKYVNYSFHPMVDTNVFTAGQEPYWEVHDVDGKDYYYFVDCNMSFLRIYPKETFEILQNIVKDYQLGYIPLECITKFLGNPVDIQFNEVIG